jgi:ABC-type branched-subunit amino acid transport system substrate-binding protein
MYGGLGTQAQTAVRDYLNSRKVPQVFVATGATTFAAEYSRYPYTFGWQPVYQGEALLYAQYLLQVAPQARVGVLYQNDDYGQDYLDGLTKGLGEQAATMIIGRQSNDVGAPDLTSQILSLQSAGADTLFLFETPAPAIKAIVSTYQTGWRPTIYLNAVAAPVPYLQAAQKSAGDAAAVNGIISALYLKDSLDPGLADDRGMQLFKQIMARYYPEGKVEDNFNVYGMGTAYSLVDVLQQAGPNPTRQGVLDALNSLNESDNPFVARGIAVKNSATDRYTITQQYLAAYDAAANDYRALGQLLDVRGLIKFP